MKRTSYGPLTTRVLRMMPVAYRLWAWARLRHLQPCVGGWATAEMFAGVAQQEAEYVACLAALVAELCTLTSSLFSGGAVDIYKCFHQIVRPLVYAILQEAGMPQRMLGPCKRLLEKMEVRNTVPGGLGEAYDEPTSIPQRDPVSMMATALRLRPWIEQMQV